MHHTARLSSFYLANQTFCLQYLLQHVAISTFSDVKFQGFPDQCFPECQVGVARQLLGEILRTSKAFGRGQ